MRPTPQLPAIVFKGGGWYSTDHRSASGATKTLGKKNNGAKTSSGDKNGN